MPLSSLILLAEIFICCISFIPFLAGTTGEFTGFLIRFMNTYIERVEALPFSVWNGLQINFAQAVLLTICLVFASNWLFNKQKMALYGCLFSLSGFLLLRSLSFIRADRQQKIIVYEQSADFIQGRQYISVPAVVSPDNVYANPTRDFFRLMPFKQIPAFAASANYISFLSQKVVVLNGMKEYAPGGQKVPVDLLILSQNPAQEAAYLSRALDIRQVVADATVPAWKCRRWQQQCDSLRIPFHDVRTKGAFVMNL